MSCQFCPSFTNPSRVLAGTGSRYFLGQRFCVLFLELCPPSFFSPSPLCAAIFKTKQALNLWPKKYLYPCTCSRTTNQGQPKMVRPDWSPCGRPGRQWLAAASDFWPFRTELFLAARLLRRRRQRDWLSVALQRPLKCVLLHSFLQACTSRGPPRLCEFHYDISGV